MQPFEKHEGFEEVGRAHKKGGTMIDKYATIDSWTYDHFTEARENLQQVTTRNLQQWAMAAASQFENFDFKASLS